VGAECAGGTGGKAGGAALALSDARSSRGGSGTGPLEDNRTEVAYDLDRRGDDLRCPTKGSGDTGVRRQGAADRPEDRAVQFGAHGTHVRRWRLGSANPTLVGRLESEVRRKATGASRLVPGLGFSADNFKGDGARHQATNRPGYFQRNGSRTDSLVQALTAASPHQPKPGLSRGLASFLPQT